MHPLDALKLLDETVARITLVRADHDRLCEAVRVVYTALTNPGYDHGPPDTHDKEP